MFKLSSRLGLALVAVALLVVAFLGPSAAAADDPKADYIVVLKDIPSVTAVAAEHAEKLKGKLKHVYEERSRGTRSS